MSTENSKIPYVSVPQSGQVTPPVSVPNEALKMPVSQGTQAYQALPVWIQPTIARPRGEGAPECVINVGQQQGQLQGARQAQQQGQGQGQGQQQGKVSKGSDYVRPEPLAANTWRDNFWLSFCACFCCFIPAGPICGLLGLIQAIKARMSASYGDLEATKKFARRACKLACATIVLGLIFKIALIHHCHKNKDGMSEGYHGRFTDYMCNRHNRYHHPKSFHRQAVDVPVHRQNIDYRGDEVPQEITYHRQIIVYFGRFFTDQDQTKQTEKIKQIDPVPKPAPVNGNPMVQIPENNMAPKPKTEDRVLKKSETVQQERNIQPDAPRAA